MAKKGYFGFHVETKVFMSCSKCDCHLETTLPKTVNSRAKARAFMVKKSNWTFLKNGWIVCDVCNWRMEQKKKRAVRKIGKKEDTPF